MQESGEMDEIRGRDAANVGLRSQSSLLEYNAMKDDQEPDQSLPKTYGANTFLPLAVMCLLLGLTGLHDVISHLSASKGRKALGALLLVIGLAGFVVNLVVFLRQRKK